MKKIRLMVCLSALLGINSADARSQNSADVREQQRCKDHKAATTPTNSFTLDANKGVAVKAGLMWKICQEGQAGSECGGNSTQFFFHDIGKHIKQNSKYAGYGGWRLPSIEELESIVEKKCKYPSMNLDVFPGKHSKLWSSSMVKSNQGDKIWALYTITGTKMKIRSGVVSGVRLVRDVK